VNRQALVEIAGRAGYFIILSGNSAREVMVREGLN
jgi:hypothetical protein